jgi:hypothetical protein
MLLWKTKALNRERELWGDIQVGMFCTHGLVEVVIRLFDYCFVSGYFCFDMFLVQLYAMDALINHHRHMRAYSADFSILSNVLLLAEAPR